MLFFFALFVQLVWLHWRGHLPRPRPSPSVENGVVPAAARMKKEKRSGTEGGKRDVWGETAQRRGGGGTLLRDGGGGGVRPCDAGAAAVRRGGGAEVGLGAPVTSVDGNTFFIPEYCGTGGNADTG